MLGQIITALILLTLLRNRMKRKEKQVENELKNESQSTEISSIMEPKSLEIHNYKTFNN